MKKIICKLCGERFDADDFELDIDADGYVIQCPNNCIHFTLRFDSMPDIKVE